MIELLRRLTRNPLEYKKSLNSDQSEAVKLGSSRKQKKLGLLTNPTKS